MFGLPSVGSQIKAAQAASAAKVQALQQSAQAATHPQAKKSQDNSKAPALPGGKAPKGIKKGKGYTFTMGKLSLLAVSLSLMLLGAFTFLSGFLVGAWYFGKEQAPQTSYAGQAGGATSGGAGGSAGLGGGVAQGIAGEAQKIGLGSIAGDQTSYEVSRAIEQTNIPGVPSFLQPFVNQVKVAVGSQAGEAAGKAVQGKVQQAATGAQHPSSSAPSQAKPAAPSSSEGGSATSSQSTSDAASAAAQGQGGQSSSSAQAPGAGGTGGAAKGDYSIQLGAYVAKENADEMLTSLQMKNYEAYVQEGKEPSGQPIYYVRVGHYNDYDMAHTVAVQFVDDNIPGATIIKVSDDNKK